MSFFGKDPAVLFEYRPGMDLSLLGGVFTNTTPNRTYLDRNGIVRYAAANVIRDGHYLNGIRHYLTEPLRINSCLWSQELDNAAWIKTRATIGINADIAPDGTLTADRLIEDTSVTLSHQINSATVNFTAGASLALSIYIKAGTRQWIALQFTGSGSAFTTYFDASTGAFGSTSVAGTGVFSSRDAESLPNGWWRLSLVGSLGGAITAGALIVYMATANGVVTYTGDGTSYISLWGMQVETPATYITSYIATTNLAVTRNADVLTFPWLHVPQGMTAYVKFVELETPNFVTVDGGSPRILQIATGGSSAPRFILYKVAGFDTYQTQHMNVAAVLSGVDVSPIRRDTVEARAVVFDNGSVQLAAAKNGAAEILGAVSAAEVLANAWSDDVLSVGATQSGLISCASAIQVIRIMAGTQALSTIRSTSGVGRAAGARPRLCSPPRFPGGLQSWGQSGKGQSRAVNNMGRTWTEVYPLLDASNPSVRGLLQQINQALREGTVWDVQHPYWHVLKGIGGGVPLVNGANQTGTLLAVDGAPLSLAGWLRAGDLVKIPSCPVIFDVTDTVSTNALGQASIPIHPPIFVGMSPLDNEKVIIDASEIFFKGIIVDVSDFPLMDVTQHIDPGLTLTWREQPQF